VRFETKWLVIKERIFFVIKILIAYCFDYDQSESLSMNSESTKKSITGKPLLKKKTLLTDLKKEKSHEHKRKHKKSKGREFLNDNECPICIRWMIRPVTNMCGHNTCQDCIEKYQKKTISYNWKCSVCRQEIPKNHKFQINNALNSALIMFGGDSYQKEIIKRENLIKQEKIIEQYQKTEKFKSLTNLIKGYIKENMKVSYPEIVEHLKHYSENEIQFILHHMLIDKKIFVHRDMIIDAGNIDQYIQRNIDKIHSNQLLILIADKINNGLNSKGAIVNKYRKSGRSKLKDKLIKLSDDDLNAFVLEIEEYNKKKEEEKEEEEKEEKKCGRCGRIHNDESDSSSSDEYETYSYEEEETSSEEEEETSSEEEEETSSDSSYEYESEYIEESVSED